MELHNIIGIETRHGFRSFELYLGDLTDPEAACDVLVVSTFAGGDYHPTVGTLVGALTQECHVDFHRLLQDAEFDLRTPFGFWISKPLTDQHFERLLCVEMVGSGLETGEIVKNVFVGMAILEARGICIQSVAMPLLGTGPQRLNPRSVMAALLPAARQALERSATLQRILFVDTDPDHVAAFDEAMNEILGRSKVRLPKAQLITNLRADILTGLDRAAAMAPIGHKELFGQLRRIIAQERTQSFEVGLLGRRLVEFVVDDLLSQPKTSPDLTRKIDKMADLGVAPWIRGYMHTLRVLGNESAHEKSAAGRTPPYVDEEDLAVCLFCAQRVLSYWIALRTNAYPA